MLKELLLVGAILAPALAYGGSPSTDLSVQIVPAGGGGGGGGGGPPTAPAPALAGCQTSNGGGSGNGSCFNTLAIYMDFTGATQSQVNGRSFNVSPISNWLDCAGATNPVWYNTGFFGYPTLCSDFSIVTDGSTQALQITVQPGETNTLSAIHSATLDLSKGTLFPTTKYVQVTLREDPAMDNPSTACGSTYCSGPDIWAFGGYNTNHYAEWDFIEMYPNSGGGIKSDMAGSYFDNASIDGMETHYSPTFASGYSHQVYHTFGERITSDGNNRQLVCFYVDGVQQNTGTSGQGAIGNCRLTDWTGQTPVGGQPASVHFNDPLTLEISGGGQLNGQHPNTELKAWVANYQVWECSNWNQANTSSNGNACAGSLISSNP